MKICEYLLRNSPDWLIQVADFVDDNPTLLVGAVMISFVSFAWQLHGPIDIGLLISGLSTAFFILVGMCLYSLAKSLHEKSKGISQFGSAPEVSKNNLKVSEEEN